MPSCRFWSLLKIVLHPVFVSMSDVGLNEKQKECQVVNSVVVQYDIVTTTSKNRCFDVSVAIAGPQDPEPVTALRVLYNEWLRQSKHSIAIKYP